MKNLRKRILLTATLIVCLLCVGCGAKAATPTQAAQTVNGEQAGKQGAKARTPEKPAPVTVKSPAVLPPPALQMLSSAGRDAQQAQPEAGFTLSVPDGIHAGEPFPVRLGGEGLQGLSILWRGKTLNLVPGANGQGAVCEALLSMPLVTPPKGATNAKGADRTPSALPLVFTALWANGKKEEFRCAIPVLRRDYPVQRLKVQSKYVTPPAAVQERIKKDRASMRAALSSSSAQKSWTLPMQRPVPGVVTSLYGLRRVFNGQERNPHKGIDFDAKTGDPVSACDAGRVVLAEEQYYGGNTVVVDHGLSVFSIYLHLSAIGVAVGDDLRRGQPVGLVGSTGRVTGPHLHFSLSVLGESVNAAKVLEGME